MQQDNPAKKRYFDFLEKHGKLPKKEDDEQSFYDGGVVEDEFDEEMGEQESPNSSGEPHTEDEMQESHPMEFMGHGGLMKRMSKGGRVPSVALAKALRKPY